MFLPVTMERLLLQCNCYKVIALIRVLLWNSLQFCVVNFITNVRLAVITASALYMHVYLTQ